MKSFCSAASAFSYLVFPRIWSEAWVPAAPSCPAASSLACLVRSWPLLWRRLVVGVESAGALLLLRAEAPCSSRPRSAGVGGRVACPLSSVCFIFIQASKQNAFHLPQTFHFSIACQVCFFLVGSVFIFNAVLFLTFKLQGGHRAQGPVCTCGLPATLSGPRFPHLSNRKINSEV